MKLESKTQWIYTPDPGVVPENEDVNCGVCGSVMKIERRCSGPRSMAGAMAGLDSIYDHFYCPHYKEGWHRQAVCLRIDAAESNSQKIADILEQEAEEVLESRMHTLPKFNS
jgi:hypothetical protein